jgi:hypothetical protein
VSSTYQVLSQSSLGPVGCARCTDKHVEELPAELNVERGSAHGRCEQTSSCDRQGPGKKDRGDNTLRQAPA